MLTPCSILFVCLLFFFFFFFAAAAITWTRRYTLHSSMYILSWSYDFYKAVCWVFCRSLDCRLFDRAWLFSEALIAPLILSFCCLYYDVNLVCFHCVVFHVFCVVFCFSAATRAKKISFLFVCFNRLCWTGLDASRGHRHRGQAADGRGRDDREANSRGNGGVGHHGGQGGNGNQHRGGLPAALGGGSDGPVHHQHQGLF